MSYAAALLEGRSPVVDRGRNPRAGERQARKLELDRVAARNRGADLRVREDVLVGSGAAREEQTIAK